MAWGPTQPLTPAVTELDRLQVNKGNYCKDWQEGYDPKRSMRNEKHQGGDRHSEQGSAEDNGGSPQLALPGGILAQDNEHVPDDNQCPE
jgi:hypothetical protein